jgi:DtxR family Mn-dependent transcriptional regulator
MNHPTHTEEDYMKAIFNLTERNKGSANTNDIAKLMNTSAASVSDMIQRLAKKEYFIYEKYHGVHLSPKGIHYTTKLIRRERLWKVFLSKTLGISWDSLSTISEQLKHVKSDILVDSLDKHLNYPKYDPHGEAIPNSEGRFTLRKQDALHKLQKGEKATLLAVRNHDSSFLKYLDQIGLCIGAEIEVIQCIDFDHSKEVLIDKSQKAVLSSQICHELYVRQLL